MNRLFIEKYVTVIWLFGLLPVLDCL